MKAKLGEVVKAVDSFKTLFNSPLFIKTSYNVKRLLTKVEAELKLYEEKRVELVKKYGEPTENNQYKFSDENKALFQKDMLELLDVEIDLERDPINLTKEDIKLSAVDIQNLEKFIIIEE